MTQRVFVYGTLLAGEANTHLLEEARLLGVAQTRPRYRMLSLGAYPGVTVGGDTAILGEVYRVNSRIMSTLDRLGDYPRLYTRELIPTPWGRAWIYLYRGERRAHACSLECAEIRYDGFFAWPGRKALMKVSLVSR